MSLQLTDAGMIRAKASIIIAAPSQKIINAYLDYSNWHQLFPLTIRDAKLLKQDSHQQTIEVDHKKAGKVINILTVLSAEVIRLEEFKPIYNGLFINRLEAIKGDTLYTITAGISLKGFYKIAGPFVQGLIKKRMERFVLEPMKNYVENKI